MKDCVRQVKIASEMPEYARNQNGNLAQQKRPLGPMRGIDTAGYGIGDVPSAPQLPWQLIRKSY